MGRQKVYLAMGGEMGNWGFLSLPWHFAYLVLRYLESIIEVFCAYITFSLSLKYRNNENNISLLVLILEELSWDQQINILNVEEILLSFDYFLYEKFILKYKPGESYSQRSRKGKVFIACLKSSLCTCWNRFTQLTYWFPPKEFCKILSEHFITKRISI